MSCQCSSRNSDICKWPLILTLPLKRAEDYGEMEKPNLETEHGAAERWHFILQLVSGCSAVALHSKIAMVAMENKEIFISRVGRSGRAAAAVVYSWGRGRGPLGAAGSTRSGAGSPRAPKHGSEPLPLSEGFARASTLVLKLCWPSGVAAWGGLFFTPGVILGVPFPAPYGPATCWGAKQRARSLSRDVLWTLGVFFAKLFIYSSNTWMTPPLRWSLFCQNALFDFLY